MVIQSRSQLPYSRVQTATLPCWLMQWAVGQGGSQTSTPGPSPSLASLSDVIGCSLKWVVDCCLYCWIDNYDTNLNSLDISDHHRCSCCHRWCQGRKNHNSRPRGHNPNSRRGKWRSSRHYHQRQTNSPQRSWQTQQRKTPSPSWTRSWPRWTKRGHHSKQSWYCCQQQRW